MVSHAGDTIHDDNFLKELTAGLDRLITLPDVVYGETALVDMDGRFIGMRRLKAPKKLGYKSFRNGMMVCHQSFIALRRSVPKYDLAYRFSSDFDWCINVMKNSERFYNAQTIISDYLSEGVTTANRRASLKERYEIMRRHYGWWCVNVYHAWFLIRGIWTKAFKRKLF